MKENEKTNMKNSIENHISTLSAEARADMASGQWDEVMTDRLYDACGAETEDEMQSARALAQEVAAE